MLELFNMVESNLFSITPGLLLAFGFFTGLQHATEADHVSAVATLVSKNRKLSKASLLGALWGAGHTATLFIAGFAVLLFAISIPAKLALSAELGVGIMLIVLGLSAIGKAKENKYLNILFGIFAAKHLHPHFHGNKFHVHVHSHDEEHDHSHKSVIVGMIHGLAGSGALMLVVLSTVGSIASGLTYIALFGIGSIVGMLAISTLIGMPFVFTAKRFVKINSYIALLAALVSVALGISIIYEISFLEGLFIT